MVIKRCIASLKAWICGFSLAKGFKGFPSGIWVALLLAHPVVDQVIVKECCSSCYLAFLIVHKVVILHVKVVHQFVHEHLEFLVTQSIEGGNILDVGWRFLEVRGFSSRTN